MNNKLRIGDKVLFSASHGTEVYKEATIVAMDVTESPFEKYGVPVEEVEWDMVKDNKVVFSVETEQGGRWGYSDQIKPFQKELTS